MENASLRARRLADLIQRVEPVTLARQRLVPVLPPLEPLLPDSGLVRGSIVGCQEQAAMSVALAVVAGASATGSWIGAVGVASLGLRAASEVGVALERLVMVAEPDSLNEVSWANMVSALIDGFDLIVIRSSPQSMVCRLRPATARRLHARLQARGSILVIVGDPGPFSTDLTLVGSDARWEGLGDGVGRLQCRRLTLSATGRRQPRQRHLEVWLPGVSGGLETLHVEPIAYRQTG